jgi:hypothetical protein
MFEPGVYNIQAYAGATFDRSFSIQVGGTALNLTLRLTQQIHLIMSLMMNNGHLFSFTIPSMPLVHMR